MKLVEWAALPGRSVFDVECWTVAKVVCPVDARVAGYVLLTAPLPFLVLAFRELEEIALYLKRPLDQITGTPYFDTDWMRDEAQAV